MRPLRALIALGSCNTATYALLDRHLNTLLATELANKICDFAVPDHSFDTPVARVNLTAIDLRDCHIESVDLRPKPTADDWLLDVLRPHFPTPGPLLVNITGFSCSFSTVYSYAALGGWLADKGPLEGHVLPTSSINISLSMEFNGLVPQVTADEAHVDVHLEEVRVGGVFGGAITELLRDSSFALQLFEVSLADPAAHEILLSDVQHFKVPDRLAPIFQGGGLLRAPG